MSSNVWADLRGSMPGLVVFVGEKLNLLVAGVRYLLTGQ